MRFAALSALAVASSTARAARSVLATAAIEPTSTFRNVVVVTDVPNSKRLGLLPGEYTIKEFQGICLLPCLHRGGSATGCRNKCDSVVEFNPELALQWNDDAKTEKHPLSRGTQGAVCHFICVVNGNSPKECDERCAGAP
ncbi:hypothetical protein PG996_005998 [Apiospora saccharicola]|uniref:Uncharacterized protein n=1 Tax=Apiospora saccharicola TaxID=335842 RepID=A0ABR1VR19_9PEZI